MDSQKKESPNKGFEPKTETQKELEIWELANHTAKNLSASGNYDQSMAAGLAYAYFKIRKTIKGLFHKLWN